MSEVRAYVLGVNGVGSVSSGVSPVEKVDLRANESVSSHVIIVNSPRQRTTYKNVWYYG